MADANRTAELHIQRYLLLIYGQYIKKLRQNKAEEPLIKAMVRCGRVFFLHLMVKSLDLLLEYGFMNANQVQIVRTKYVSECKILRGDAVALVDSMGFPDFILKAPIGRFDGDIYTGIFYS